MIIALDLVQHCSTLTLCVETQCPRPLYLQLSSLSDRAAAYILSLSFLFLRFRVVTSPPGLLCFSSCSSCVAPSIRGERTQFLDISHLFTKHCTHKSVLSQGTTNPPYRWGDTASHWWDQGEGRECQGYEEGTILQGPLVRPRRRDWLSLH